MRKNPIRPWFEASTRVTYRCGKGPYYAQYRRQMEVHLLRMGDLLTFKQRQGANHATLLDWHGVASTIRGWLKGLVPEDKGGLKGIVSGVSFCVTLKSYHLDAAKLQPAKLQKYVNENLLPSLHIEAIICEGTAVWWLHKLGYRVSHAMKGIYVDGHEPHDIVTAHKVFIETVQKDILPHIPAQDLHC